MLTEHWAPWDFDYEKTFYSIRTKDGKEYMCCWPNAGKFSCFTKDNPKDNISIDYYDVTHVKIGIHPMDWV